MADVTLRQIRSALDARDPEVVALIVDLAGRPIPSHNVDGSPFREGALTLNQFIGETRTSDFRTKNKAEQHQYRVQQFKSIEADDAEVTCPDRLKIYEVIEELWEGEDVFTRSTLIEVLKSVPLTYGPWRAIKRIFKEAEAKNDTEVYATIAARVDCEAVGGYRMGEGPTQGTLLYMRRRAWRYLRRIGETFPAIYPDVATDFLAAYGDLSHYQLRNTWVAAHILAHEGGEFNRNRFLSIPSSFQKSRAFPDLWTRSPRPLFSLLERAKSDCALQFATQGLKTDFRASLREVESEWVQRLFSVKRTPVDEFAVWILENVPKFEQSAFRELGLHDGVVGLLGSESRPARKYGCEYTKVHARDLPLETLIRCIKADRKSVVSLAKELILERDARNDIGLEGWGELLEATEAADWVQESVRKHFGASELTPDWFKHQLFKTRSYAASEFFKSHLLKLHSAESLGFAYFMDLIESREPESYDHNYFALEQITELGPKNLDVESLKRLLIGSTGEVPIAWVEQGLVEPNIFTTDFLKVLAFHPEWETDEWIAAWRHQPTNAGAGFDESLSTEVISWLSDIRKFTPDELGFEWLMQLVQRSEPRYHDFAVDTMIRGFLPADFATPDESAAPAEASPEAEINIDLGGQKFLFTGKLATMTRSEAKKKVTSAGGANASGVAKTLHYLVIGDEGSPLYGEGRKGSKQLKAESLREEGADLKIISETAFLQMLTGEVREFSDDAVSEGCERLWSMMVEAKREDDPLAIFARKYFRRHHPEICLKETDRPVDPGAEIPDSFLTFQQVKPLFSNARKTLRDFALEMAHWEFARWQPPIEGIIDLCEVPYPEVRGFVAKTLTADDAPEHKTYRMPNEILTPQAVYSFCESNDVGTRALGMLLIDRNPHLRVPEELFRLTESPDRKVRAFVVRSFWSLYRDRDSTRGWKPKLPPQATTGKKAKKDAAIAAESLGPGVPENPENPPADQHELRALLRRILYEIPPGPPEKTSGARIADTLAPLPHRKAKLYLIETIRDLAIEDEAFSREVYPLFEEFMKSRGKSEFEACLVAVTRLKSKWGEAAA